MLSFNNTFPDACVVTWPVTSTPQLACIAGSPRRFPWNVCLGVILDFGRGETKKEQKSDEAVGSRRGFAKETPFHCKISPAPLPFITNLGRLPWGTQATVYPLLRGSQRGTRMCFLFFPFCVGVSGFWMPDTCYNIRFHGYSPIFLEFFKANP